MIASLQQDVRRLRTNVMDQTDVNDQLRLENARIRGIMVRQTALIEGLRKRVVEVSAMLPSGTEADPIEID